MKKEWIGSIFFLISLLGFIGLLIIGGVFLLVRVNFLLGIFSLIFSLGISGLLVYKIFIE